MKLLFDAHTLIWFLDGDRKLPPRWRDVRPGETDDCDFSICSYWEIGIKIALGKLRLTMPFDHLAHEIVGRGFRILQLQPAHCHEVSILPWHHRDPFDRMLVAQARVEGHTIVSGDPWLAGYDVRWVWK